MLNITNNVARTSWKFYTFRDCDIEQYIDYITDYTPTTSDTVYKRHLTIHKLNYFLPVSLHTGKWVIEPNLNKYHFGFKFGQLTKTRKPYYFRSKKKKNVKKNYLP